MQPQRDHLSELETNGGMEKEREMSCENGLGVLCFSDKVTLQVKAVSFLQIVLPLNHRLNFRSPQ